MRLEAILWTGVTVYYVVIGAIYWIVGGDPVGVAVLLMATGLGGLVAGWTWDWSRTHGTRVEDQAGTDAADRLGIVGVYPTASLRPFALAVGVTALVAGIPIGSWLSMIGFAIICSQLLLLVRDADT
jgi:hypothetical protein